MEQGFAVALVFGTIFSFVVLIVRMAMKHSEAKLRIVHSGAAGADPGVAAAHIEIAALKQRVQVLEKLVTDDDRKLADEINRLRRDTGEDIRG